jgi:hypothetical protein
MGVLSPELAAVRNGTLANHDPRAMLVKDSFALPCLIPFGVLFYLIGLTPLIHSVNGRDFTRMQHILIFAATHK